MFESEVKEINTEVEVAFVITNGVEIEPKEISEKFTDEKPLPLNTN